MGVTPDGKTDPLFGIARLCAFMVTAITSRAEAIGTDSDVFPVGVGAESEGVDDCCRDTKVFSEGLDLGQERRDEQQLSKLTSVLDMSLPSGSVPLAVTVCGSRGGMG